LRNGTGLKGLKGSYEYTTLMAPSSEMAPTYPSPF